MLILMTGELGRGVVMEEEEEERKILEISQDP